MMGLHAHAAHAHATATASTAPLGGGGVREIGGSGDGVEANIATKDGGPADQGGGERTNSNPAHGRKPFSYQFLGRESRRIRSPLNELERRSPRFVA